MSLGVGEVGMSPRSMSTDAGSESKSSLKMDLCERVLERGGRYGEPDMELTLLTNKQKRRRVGVSDEKGEMQLRAT
jgi:hypothetical protein